MFQEIRIPLLHTTSRSARTSRDIGVKTSEFVDDWSDLSFPMIVQIHRSDNQLEVYTKNVDLLPSKKKLYFTGGKCSIGREEVRSYKEFSRVLHLHNTNRLGTHSGYNATQDKISRVFLEKYGIGHQTLCMYYTTRKLYMLLMTWNFQYK